MKFTASRGSKRKVIQLDLFNIVPQTIEDDVFSKFRAYAFDLMAKGIWMSGPWVTTCENWWRSRFHDMLYPGHNAPKDTSDWQYRNAAETNWQLIWKRFELDILDVTNNNNRAVQSEA